MKDKYLIEMLCCLPKEMLLAKLDNSNDISEWLKQIDSKVVLDALTVYNNKVYTKRRKSALKRI